MGVLSGRRKFTEHPSRGAGFLQVYTVVFLTMQIMASGRLHYFLRARGDLDDSAVSAGRLRRPWRRGHPDAQHPWHSY